MVYFPVSVIILYISFIEGHNLSGTIEEDIKFYHRKLSENPSILATIEYSVTFKHHFGHKKLRIFTSDNHTAFKDKCLSSNYGQLFNEDLHTPLGSNYRRTKCEAGKDNPIFNHCYGKIRIQDYIPRHYSFSFGFYCGENGNISLHGLSYNISIYDQTNETSCFRIPRLDNAEGGVQCKRYYSHTSLPNLMGDATWQHLSKWLVVFGSFAASLTSLVWKDLCHRHVQEILCRAFMPKCDTRNKQIIQPCKETCIDLLEGCGTTFETLIDKLGKLGDSFLFDVSHIRQIAHSPVECPLIDCNYLPSVKGPIPCFYEPVTCAAPPELKNATFVGNSTKTYPVLSTVEYSCLNNSLFLQGNNTVTCLYSGKWSKTPQCIEKPPKISITPNTLPVVKIILSALILIFVLVIALGFLIWCKLKKKPKGKPLTRNRMYDAFVCYDLANDDFAHKTLIDELEERHDPPFKLCIHKRNFKPSYTIKWNIWNAIKNSNSAIIVMSQDFVDSMWCRDEFEGCYVENLEDAAFRLFVIMMQPVESLQNTDAYMKSFFASRTYLERTDNKLFKKISEYLTSVKRPLQDNENEDSLIAKEKQQERFPEEDILSHEFEVSNDNIQDQTDSSLSPGSSSPSVTPGESSDETVSLLSSPIATSAVSSSSISFHLSRDSSLEAQCAAYGS